MRTLIFLILLIFALWWLQRTLARLKSAAAERARARELAAQEQQRIEPMRECAYCGVNIPDTEAIADGSHFYCCDSHRRAGPGAG